MKTDTTAYSRRSVLAIATLVMLTSTQMAAAADRIVMQVIPKLIGIPYFTSTGEGAKEAAAELGIEMNYNGPTDASIEGQIAIINQAIDPSKKVRDAYLLR